MKLCVLSIFALTGASAFQLQRPAAFTTSLNSQFSYGAGPADEPPRTVNPEMAGINGGLTGVTPPAANPTTKVAKDIWDTLTPVLVQGSSLRTWSFSNQNVKRVQVLLKTEGRPLNANVDLWQGPDNTPQKMGVYIEDGSLRPFCAVLETPRGQNAVAIRNTGQMEFPLSACVEADVEDANGNSSAGLDEVMKTEKKPEIIQGGALKTYSFVPSVASVRILLKTDGRPLNARVELLQGPNNNKEVIELYCEDGMERPFFAILETPGVGNVVRVMNTAPVEFPMTCSIEPYVIDNEFEDDIIVADGERSWGRPR